MNIKEMNLILKWAKDLNRFFSQTLKKYLNPFYFFKSLIKDSKEYVPPWTVDRGSSAY